MAVLNPSTLRRLQKLPQIPSVWEGDRRAMASHPDPLEDSDTEAPGECIIWVDGSEGVVRAMDMVPLGTGPEAIVRTLLRAIEHPQSPGPAARPQKIVVKDREIQFFLRGVLQNLGIAIDYVPELPLIDEIFRGMQEVAHNRPPQLPPQYAERLTAQSKELWQLSPWKYLGEHQIISIEVNQWDIQTLYISILGSGQMDYGILMYRSIESLKRFRQRVVNEDSFENLEQAFLGQDCLFLTFEIDEDDEDEEDDLDTSDIPLSRVEPNFGNLHPLEGLRSILYEEESLTMLVALEAFNRFLKANKRKFLHEKFPPLNNRYRIPLEGKDNVISLKVMTLPDIADELWQMMVAAAGDDDDEDDLGKPLLKHDLIPENSFLSLGMIPWETIKSLRESTQVYQASDGEIKEDGDGFPVILIQTSNPKAKTLIQELQDAGGVRGITFNPGEDPFAEEEYDLGIFQTVNEQLHLFGEFHKNDPIHQEARRKWDRRCQNTKGWCGLIIAKGLMGASRGQPQSKDMMALYEVRSLSPKDLGLGTLQLVSMF